MSLPRCCSNSDNKIFLKAILSWSIPPGLIAPGLPLPIDKSVVQITAVFLFSNLVSPLSISGEFQSRCQMADLFVADVDSNILISEFVSSENQVNLPVEHFEIYS